MLTGNFGLLFATVLPRRAPPARRLAVSDAAMQRWLKSLTDTLPPPRPRTCPICGNERAAGDRWLRYCTGCETRLAQITREAIDVYWERRWL